MHDKYPKILQLETRLFCSGSLLCPDQKSQIQSLNTVFKIYSIKFLYKAYNVYLYILFEDECLLVQSFYSLLLSCSVYLICSEKTFRQFNLLSIPVYLITIVLNHFIKTVVSSRLRFCIYQYIMHANSNQWIVVFGFFFFFWLHKLLLVKYKKCSFYYYSFRLLHSSCFLFVQFQFQF